MRKRFILLYIAAGSLLSIFLIVIVCNAKVENAAAGKTFSIAKDVPFNKVGLILGTGKTTAGGFITDITNIVLMPQLSYGKSIRFNL